MDIKHKTIIYPRMSSDYCFYVQEKNKRKEDAAIFGICDTIGHIPYRNLKKVVTQFSRDLRDKIKQGDYQTIGDLTNHVREQVLAYNSTILKYTPEDSDEPFGLCLTTGVMYQGKFQYFSIGDCRGYFIQGKDPQPDGPDFDVSLITHDHNRLYLAVTEEGSYTFMKNELTGFSKTLTCFWGSNNVPDLKAKLYTDYPVYDLKKGDHVLFITDGIYFPIIRFLMKQHHYTLHDTDFFLAEWMKDLVEDLRYHEWEDGKIDARKLLTVLSEISLDLAPRGSRYRDDMAGIAVTYDG